MKESKMSSGSRQIAVVPIFFKQDRRRRENDGNLHLSPRDEHRYYSAVQQANAVAQDLMRKTGFTFTCNVVSDPTTEYQRDVRRAMIDGYRFIVYFNPKENPEELHIDSEQLLAMRDDANTSWPEQNIHGIVREIQYQLAPIPTHTTDDT